MFVTLRARGALLTLAACFAALLVAARLVRPSEKAVAASSNAPKTVYLTYDDGPSQYTAELLDVLAARGVKATFFVTGQCEEYLPLIKRAHDEGHLIALHTYSHDFSEIYSSREAFWNDIDKLQDVIVAQTGQPSRYLRFAGGSSNTVCKKYGGGEIMRSLAADCGERGIVYADWNVDTRDAQAGVKSASYISSRAVKGAAEHDEATILMHDGTMGENAAAATDAIIEQLTAAGCVFARLDEQSEPVHHSLP